MRSINFRVVASVLATLAILVATTASGETTSTDSASTAGKGSASKSNLTKPQENAIEAANTYLGMSGFSKKGLIQQLSSHAGDGYPKKDAKFAVKHIQVNWNKQAVRSAKEYLDTSSFSCQGMIEQLSSSAGSGYTTKQATYAAKKVGLC